MSTIKVIFYTILDLYQLLMHNPLVLPSWHTSTSFSCASNFVSSIQTKTCIDTTPRTFSTWRNTVLLWSVGR